MENLTPEQIALQDVVRDEWIAVGHSCEPADFGSAREAISRLYIAASLVVPAQWEFVPSPLAGEKRALSLGASRLQCDWGQHDVAWLAYHDYMRRIGVDYGDKDELLSMFIQIARSCGWWWPFDQAVIISDRPEELHLQVRNGRHVLHSTNRPAIRYRDGFAVYAVGGVRVPEEIIEHPEQITVEACLNERNAEISRTMVDLMGDRFIREANAEVLDEDTDGAGMRRRLLSVAMPRDPDRVYVGVEVTCPSTGHVYILRVPPVMRTCLQAVAWTFGMSGEVYAPMVES